MKARNCEEFLLGAGVAENNSSGAVENQERGKDPARDFHRGCYTGFWRGDARL